MRHIRCIVLALSLLLLPAGLRAEDTAVLLEKAIYTEDTAGDLDAAIALYRQIVADTDAARATAAQALYRLGMCYRKSGDTKAAAEAFARLTSQYPEQKELIAVIPAMAVPAQFGPAVWENGEVLQYVGRTNGLGDYGMTLALITDTESYSGTPAWKMRTIYAQGQIIESNVVYMNQMDRKYVPLEMVRKRMGAKSSMRYRSRYFPDHIVISNMLSGKEKQKNFAVNGSVYDYTQIINLLRVLPLRAGYETTLSVAPTSITFTPGATSAVVRDIKVRVEGRERVTVPAGTFDCFRIALETGQGKELYWLSSASPFYPVKVGDDPAADLKYDDDVTVQIYGDTYAVRSNNPSKRLRFELSAITQLSKSGPASFTDAKSGLKFSVPTGWVIANTQLGVVQLITAIDPDDKTNCFIHIGRTSGSLADLTVHPYYAAHGDRELEQKKITDGNFTGIRQLFEISPSVEDSVDDKEMMLDNTAYIVKTDKERISGVITFMTRKEDYARYKADFEFMFYSIENSLRAQ